MRHASFLRREVGAVTRGALQGSWLVEENLFSVNETQRVVAAFAFHLGMAAIESKPRAFIVIEGRRNPSVCAVAIGARRSTGLCAELRAMWVHMAAFAQFRRAFELNFRSIGRRLVTVVTGHRAMNTEQRKCGLAVIEPSDRSPGVRVVASLTPKC